MSLNQNLGNLGKWITADSNGNLSLAGNITAISGTFASNVLINGATISNDEVFGVNGNAMISKSANPVLYMKDASQSSGKKIFEVLNNSNSLLISRLSDNFSVRTTYFTMLDGGNVGIGQSSPATKLDIGGNIRLSSSFPVIEMNNGGPQLYVTASNTLSIASGGGIGTPSNVADFGPSLINLKTNVVQFQNNIVGKNYSVSNVSGTTNVTLEAGCAYLLTVTSGTAGQTPGFVLGGKSFLYLIHVPGPGYPYTNYSSTATQFASVQSAAETNAITCTLSFGQNGAASISLSGGNGGTVNYGYSFLKLSSGVSY